MDKESRIRTNKSAFVVKPILIKGFERTWGLNGGMYKITFLTIIKKENSAVNAVYYPVSIKDLNKTDRRESGYCRVKVEGKDLSFYGKKINYKSIHHLKLYIQTDLCYKIHMPDLVRYHLQV